MSVNDQTRSLCVQLVLQAVVSYRSIPRILQLLSSQSFAPGSSWRPHFSSVIHWSLRLGLGLLERVQPIDSPWLAIIDHSIGVGTKKALVVLRVRLDTLSERNEEPAALQLSDCECIGLRVSETVNGESIEGELRAIFEQAGTPVGVIKDGDTTLNKGVCLWSQQAAPELEIIDDLSHKMAGALKKHYQDNDAYTEFIAWTQTVAKKLRQTALAFLIPPKLRKKGRFLSISRLGRWSQKLLDRLGQTQETSEQELFDSIQAAVPDANPHRHFIQEFAHTTSVIVQVMKVLKNQGLKFTTYQACCRLAQPLPSDSGIRQALQSWLDQHRALQQRIGAAALPISSDVIESLFGCFKHLIERNPQADMNRSVLLIPALCGRLDPITIREVLHQTPHAKLAAWEQEHIPYTLRKKRRAFFQNDKPKNRENDS